jgi:outer membrane protein assembly factor BamD (BamD/ComL family)
MTHSIRDIGRRPTNSWAGFLSAAAMLALVCLWLSPQAALSAEKKESQQISRVIAKEMTAAQKALQASQWAEAIKNLEAAETKSGLNAFDKKTIYDFKGFAYVKLNNLKAAEQAYEAAIATGAYSPEDAAKTTRMLFRLSAGNQQYAKAAEYGKQVADSGTATADDLGILSQIFYLQKDCKNSGLWADKAIAAARKAGEAPKENLYQFKLQCASDSGDTPGMAATLVDLIKLTNKTNYWNTLLRIERQEERDDHNTLMLYRVMYDTASMNAGTDYIEMAQLLGDAALPAEAQTVLEKAMGTAGLITDQQKERTTRLLNSLKARADADKKGLAQLDAEATKNPAGELDVKLGEVYYGVGDYQNAVTAINRGLQKQQIKHLDEAYVYLGRAQVALKNTADAKKAFAGLKNVPNVSPRVLKLWELYADTLGR